MNLPEGGRSSAKYVFTSYRNSTGFTSKSYVYMIGASGPFKPARTNEGILTVFAPRRLGPYLRRHGHGGVRAHGRRHEEAIADGPARHVLERSGDVRDGLGVDLRFDCCTLAHFRGARRVRPN